MKPSPSRIPDVGKFSSPYHQFIRHLAFTFFLQHKHRYFFSIALETLVESSRGYRSLCSWPMIACFEIRPSRGMGNGAAAYVVGVVSFSPSRNSGALSKLASDEA